MKITKHDRPMTIVEPHKFRPATMAAQAAAYDTIDMEELEVFELPYFRRYERLGRDLEGL